MLYSPLAKGFGIIITAHSGDSLEDVHVSSVHRLLAKSGAVLLREFAGVSVNTFGRLSAAFQVPLGLTIGNANRCLRGDAHIRQISNRYASIDCHADNAALPTRPDFLSLCCLSASQKGGETTLCDGCEVLEALEPDLRTLFEGRRLKYGPLCTPKEVWSRSLGTSDVKSADTIIREALRTILDHTHEEVAFTFSDEGDLEAYYLTSAIVRSPFSKRRSFSNALCGPNDRWPTFEDDSAVSSTVVDRLKQIESAHTVEVKWRRGDVLTIDNWRIMHGRRAIHASDGRVIAHRMGRRSAVRGFVA